MQTTHKGKYWTTVVSRFALYDQKRFDIPQYAMDELVEQFHSLGDKLAPTAQDYRLKALANPDYAGIYRFKSYTPEIKQLRGITMIFKQDEGQRRGALVLIGVFVRDAHTYDETLVERLAQVKEASR